MSDFLVSSKGWEVNRLAAGLATLLVMGVTWIRKDMRTRGKVLDMQEASHISPMKLQIWTVVVGTLR